MKKNDIENSRSRQVQDMIDKIPNTLIKWGYVTFFIILMSVVLLAMLIKSPHELSLSVIFEKKDNLLIGWLLIPEKNLSKVKSGQDVIIYLESESELIFKSKICEISKTTISKGNSIYYKGKICEIENIKITKESKGIAKISIEDISFLERINNLKNNLND